MATASVQTTLNFHNPERTIFYPGTAGNYKRKDDVRNVEINDLRGLKPPHIDEQGYEVHHHVSQEKDFFNEEIVKSDVYNEISELLKEKYVSSDGSIFSDDFRVGATTVKPFSHIIRRNRWEDAYKVAENAPDSDLLKFTVPARFVHVDQSYHGAEQIFEANVDSGERTVLSKTRWGIINVWRPIHNVVKRDPLAVCDATTVEDNDLIGVSAQLPPKGTGTFDAVSKGNAHEIFELVSNPKQKWYYASDMTPDEVMFIKCFDSKKDGRARQSPHSAFVNPTTAHNSEPRESIEVRCLVFWEDQEVG